jgi:hypothetical protein
LALLWTACAGDWVSRGPSLEGFRHRARGWEVELPPPSDGGTWERVEVAGAALSFRGQGDLLGASMSLVSECPGSEAPPAVLARHLVIGIDDRALVHAGPVQLRGLPGWSQTFDAVEGERSIRLKTVTLAGSDCTFDWILVTPDSFDRIERGFDRWWRSFRPAERMARREPER